MWTNFFLPRSWRAPCGPRVWPVTAVTPLCTPRPHSHVMSQLTASSLHLPAHLTASRQHAHRECRGHGPGLRQRALETMPHLPPPPTRPLGRDLGAQHLLRTLTSPAGHATMCTSAHLSSTPPPHQGHELRTPNLQGPQGATTGTAAPPPPHLPQGPAQGAEASARCPEAQTVQGKAFRYLLAQASQTVTYQRPS